MATAAGSFPRWTAGRGQTTHEEPAMTDLYADIAGDPIELSLAPFTDTVFTFRPLIGAKELAVIVKPWQQAVEAIDADDPDMDDALAVVDRVVESLADQLVDEDQADELTSLDLPDFALKRLMDYLLDAWTGRDLP